MDAPGSGEAWDQAQALSNVEWRPTVFPESINGLPITDQRISCDIHRLRTLQTEGGFFADLDFVFLGSFETLRHNEAIIGIQCKAKQKLACGLMGSVPGGAFITAYLDAYKDWTPEEQSKWWKFANTVPWTLSKLHPVTVIARPMFYPWCWSNKKFIKGGVINLKKSVAIHLWESLYPEVNVEALKKTAVARWIKELEGEMSGSVKVQEGGLLEF